MDIRTQSDAGVLTLTLDRPAKKNALTRAMYSRLADALDEADRDTAVRAVIIAAEGDDFSAGNDIFDFAQGMADAPGDDLEAMPVFRFLKALTYFSKPLVAAVQGKAVGVGVTLLLHCDLVVVTRDAQLRLPFLQLGLVPEAGSTLLLPQRIGHVRAFEWLSQGEVVSAERAVDWGIANRLVAREDLAATAESLAQGVTRLSPAAVAQTKRFLRDPDQVWQVVQAEGRVFRQLLTSPEAMAAFSAFLNRS